MEALIYIAFFVLFVVCGYLWYKHIQLGRRLKEQDIDHKKALTDAGNAITDTLRVAFDNLKRNTGEHNKIHAKLTEHNSRIHRLEQNINRKTQPIENSSEYIDEFDKNSHKKQKE